MADSYRLNPYDGNIFPGKDIKLFRNATQELDKKERFSLVNSDPISITIAISEASSHFYWNKTCTIATVYDNAGAGSAYVDMICNPEDLSLSNKCATRQLLLGLQLIMFRNLIQEMFSRSILLPRKPIAQPFNVALDQKSWRLGFEVTLMKTLLRLCHSRAPDSIGMYQQTTAAG